MKNQIQERLKQLRSEYEIGQQKLQDLQQQQINLEQTLFRISGAIQVLEELMIPKQEESSIPSENGVGIENKSEAVEMASS